MPFVPLSNIYDICITYNIGVSTLVDKILDFIIGNFMPMSAHHFLEPKLHLHMTFFPNTFSYTQCISYRDASYQKKIHNNEHNKRPFLILFKGVVRPFYCLKFLFQRLLCTYPTENTHYLSIS